MARTDLTGHVFGMLTVEHREPGPRDRAHPPRWRCRCACGGTTVALASNLTTGRTQSCGCGRIKHGLSRTPTWVSWKSMLDRCRAPRGKNHANYAARGIRVCAEWQDEHGFERFLADMGERPEGTTLDRKDNDGNYEPGNCRWATPVEQRANRRPVRRRAA